MLYIIRGLPGSGKTTLANAIKSDTRLVIEADQFFIKNGKYRFDPTRLASAHQDCLARATSTIEDGLDVIVSNTFIKFEHIGPYIEMALSFGCDYTIIDLYDGGLSNGALYQRNAHNVPYNTIARMRREYERR